MNLIEKLEELLKQENKMVLSEDVTFESGDNNSIVIKKDGEFIHETKSALAALWFLKDEKYKNEKG